ncbi:MAG: hypothetical protein QE272_04990 [Nevskia sp.]|nr:hypothetical protein [Nevskia sp.]
MIKIFLPGNRNGNVRLWFEAASGGTENPPSFFSRSLYISVANIEGRLVFAEPFEIPELIVVRSGDDLLLKTWDEAVNAAEGELGRRSAQALEALSKELRKRKLIVADATAEHAAIDFFGLSSIGAARTTFHIQINPEGLLPGGPVNLPIFRAEAIAVFAAGFRSPLSAVDFDAEFRLEITLTAAGVLQLLPRLTIPQLPHFVWTFPEHPLTNWSLQGLHLPQLDVNLFRLPLQQSLGIQTAVAPQPGADFTITDGNLKLRTTPTTVTISFDQNEVLVAENVVLTVDGTNVAVTATNIVSSTGQRQIGTIDLSDAFGPLHLTLESVIAQVDVSAPGANGPIEVKLTLTIGRLLIKARKDPSMLLCLAVGIELSYINGALHPVLQRLDIVEPYPIKLGLAAASSLNDGVRQLLSLIQRIDIPAIDAPAAPSVPTLDAVVAVIKRIAALAAAAATWVAEQGVVAAQALAGLAEAALKMLGELIAELADVLLTGAQAIAKAVVVEVRIDTDRWCVAQLVITPVDPAVGTEAFTRTILGVKLEIPYELSPALVCDFDQGWAAIVLQLKTNGEPVRLSTDLWLDNDVTGTTEPVSGSRTENVDEPLLSLTVTRPTQQQQPPPYALAIAGVKDGKAFFLQKLDTTPSQDNVVDEDGALVVASGHLLLSANLSGLQSIGNGDFVVTPAFQSERILSLFRSAQPAADNNRQGLAEQLSQYIKVKATGQAELNLPTLTVPLDLQIQISDSVVETSVDLNLNLETLSVAIKGGIFDIALRDNTFELLKLKGEFRDRVNDTPPVVNPLFLDLRDGDVRLGLKESARIDLYYDQLSSSGKGLGFSVDRFVVSRDGIELDAAVREADPVTLSGVDMPFRFAQGALSVRRSQIQAFSIAGYGNLPPALVGEARASIELNFTQKDGGLALQAASAVLDKSADPLRCEGTQFSITVSKLGLKYVQEQNYHFYFTLTGAAEFRPSSGAFANGLLKNLSSLNIVLNEAPLATDPRVLLKHIEFQVTVDPPKRSSFFDLFDFELRGVGFHPSSDAFGGSPALSISGQVNFTDFADIISPRFDFHKLWIAPPKQGQILPRIRFDGLGVGLALGSTAEISGTAIAVDGQLPSLVTSNLSTKLLGEGDEAKGFLASGTLKIQGWAPMSASIGVLELERPGVAERRLALFLSFQQYDLSVSIPTPIGVFKQRVVTYALAKHYTLPGFAALDRAGNATPSQEFLPILDQVSKFQGNIDDPRNWLTTFDNAGLTLAMRSLFSLTSASSPYEYNEEGEKDLPNLVLFDVVAALRTDLTFLMNVRAWIAYNYADWRKARTENSPWRNNPTLTGYMYLSAPRREFLARAVYNPGGEIGEHPKFPDELKAAMKAVRWSSTLYIRPGLFHMEYGWPYELGFSLGKQSDNFYLAVEGGCVLRFEDSAVLYGLAFRARGFAKFAYEKRGSFGAAIAARADFALGAKLIAYVSSDVARTMFYGVIALDVTLEFSVRMWLKTKWLSLSISFSRSITIHVGIELLFEPEMISGRVEATVAVSAFGRSLSLGIGFPLGQIGRLNSARARVDRFLSLGLGSSYPNPEAGVPVSRPAPLPEPSRGNNAIQSDVRVEDNADRIAITAPPAEDDLDLDVLPGRPITTVHYWALLFPVPASDDTPRYLVQLIPMDAGLSGNLDDMHTATHFFAAPLGTHVDGRFNPHADADYRVTGINADEVLPRNTPVSGVTPSQQIRTDWFTTFGRPGNGADASEVPPKLWEAFEFGCFLAGMTIPASGGFAERILALTDIDNIPWDKDAFLPDDPEKASLVLKAAARSREECGPKWKRVLQIDEARSCFIATLAESAQQLASLISFTRGVMNVDDSRARALEFDPRALGLSFVLKAERINELFIPPQIDDGSPVKSTTFTVQTRLPVNGAAAVYSSPTEVALFNPPKRMFFQGSPVLKEPKAERRATGILLFWDLEWRFRTSLSLYADPEFHLKHYRIERRIEGLPSGIAPAPRIFEAKKGDLIELCLLRDKDGKLLLDSSEQPQLRKRRYRSRLQFADDLQELRADLRAQLLTPVTANDRRLAQTSLLTYATKVIYTVLPVDEAGTYGVPPEPLTIDAKKPSEPQKSLLKAIARFRYDRVPILGQTFSPQAASFLTLTVEEEALPANHDDEPPTLGAARRLQLRIRGERTVAVGVFGADALSQARNEPPIPGRSDSKPGASDKDITLQNTGSGRHRIQVTRLPRRLATRTTPGPNLEGIEQRDFYTLNDGDWQVLLMALDIGATERVKAARLYVRPLPEGNDAELHPEWIPVQLQMQIGKLGQEPAVDVTIERFEHPMDVEFEAIASGNITPSSGRLHLYHPRADTSFAAFLRDASSNRVVVGPAGQLEPHTVDLLRDGERRTAVRLAWEARPADLGIVGEQNRKATGIAGRHSLIGGYDLFSLDATAVPRDADKRPGWPERFIRPLGRVQRLPTSQRGIEPSETGDFGRVEVLYPSETRRLTKATGSKRRANWFSPAETCLLWPKRVLRRSVLTLPDETDIAALFARGRPSYIRVDWTATKALSANFACMLTAEKKPQPPTGFVPLAGGSFSVETTRRLLLSLVLVGDLSTLDEQADGQPNTFDGLKLALTALDSNSRRLSAVEVNVALAPSLHPILADVLDLVQYDSASTTYRRYEPVLDTSPPVNATQLDAFLDETVADRDPSGWGVLRTLGLAVGVRLYDVEAGEFLRAGDALARLNNALQEVLPRYDDAPQAFGAPFVDVMFTSDGLADTASFQGAAGVTSDAAKRLVDEHALALVQIELRPTPQPYVMGYNPSEEPRIRPQVSYANLYFELRPLRQPYVIDYKPAAELRHRPQVRYATLRRIPATDTKLRASDVVLRATKPNVLLEIEPRVRAAGQSTHRVLLMNGRDGQRFPEGSSDMIAGALRLEAQADESVLAYLRIISFDPCIRLDGDDLTTIIQIERVLPDNVTFELLAASAEPTDEAGPWGRFSDLPDLWLAALLFKDGTGSGLSPDVVLAETPFGDTLSTLMRILGRMSGKEALGKPPVDAPARLQLASKLGPWTRRFLERGAARSAARLPLADRVGVAFAMLTRPQPWRLAPSSDGKLSVTLFEKDRFGKLRKYAVRPFGRYESLVRAVRTHDLAAEAKASRRPAPALPPPGLDKQALPGVDPLRCYFADVSIERTEPLAAPVIVAARRKDDTVDGVTRPGRTVQIIVSRHPEEALADANIPVDAGIAMRHVAIGFWREFSAPKWASAVQAGGDAIPLLEPFGPFKNAELDYSRLKPPKALTLVTHPGKPHPETGTVPVYDLQVEQPRAWYEQHPDLWTGAHVLTLADLPYGFRLHATAHAAAGVVVSSTSVATVGEMGYRLALPWKEGIEGDEVPWQDRKVPAPSWSLVDANQRAVRIRWPLVRIVDGLFDDVRRFWLGNEEAPEVYRLPDPAVSYRISVSANNGRIRIGEAEFSAIAEAPGGNQSGLYLAQAVGTRFEQAKFFSLNRLPTHYELTVDLELRPGDAVPPPQPQQQPIFAGAAHNSVPAPDGLHVPMALMAGWGRIAPSPRGGKLNVVITPPTALDPPALPFPVTALPPPDQSWSAFRATLEQYVEALRTYAAGSVPERVTVAAAAIAAEVARYAVDRVADWPGPRSTDGKTALAVTRAVPWLLGLPATTPEVAVQAPAAWEWPSDPGRDAALADSRTLIAAELQQSNASPVLSDAVDQALHAYAAAWMVYRIAIRRHLDEVPWRGLASLRDEAPTPVTTAHLTADADGPVDFVATVELPNDDRRSKAAIENAFSVLEATAQTAETLEGLLLLWFAPTQRIQLPLRWSGWAAIEPVLTPLSRDRLNALSISTVILRKPMLQAETTGMVNAHAGLPALLDTMTRAMLFGRGGKLVIQAFHGLAKPVEGDIEEGVNP